MNLEAVPEAGWLANPFEQVTLFRGHRHMAPAEAAPWRGVFKQGHNPVRGPWVCVCWAPTRNAFGSERTLSTLAYLRARSSPAHALALRRRPARRRGSTCTLTARAPCAWMRRACTRAARTCSLDLRTHGMLRRPRLTANQAACNPIQGPPRFGPSRQPLLFHGVPLCPCCHTPHPWPRHAAGGPPPRTQAAPGPRASAAAPCCCTMPTRGRMM